MLDGLNVFLTRSCNLRCPYCFVEKNGAGHMTEQMREATLSFITSYLDLHSPRTHVGYIGGEPLLAFDNFVFFTESLRKVDDNVNIGFTTNGVLMDECICEYLVENRIRTVVSMDGTKKAMATRMMPNGSNAHDKVVDTIEMLLQHRANMLVQMTITPENASDFLENVRYVAQLGVRRILFGIDYEARWDDDSLDSFAREIRYVFSWYYEVYRQNKQLSLKYIDNELISYLLFSAGKKRGDGVCPIAKSIIAIDVDGEIYPCQAFVDMPKWSLGNVKTGIDFRKQSIVSTISRLSPCDSCKLNAFCRKCPRCNDLICGDATCTNSVSCRVSREFYFNLEWFSQQLLHEENPRFLAEYGSLLKAIQS